MYNALWNDSVIVRRSSSNGSGEGGIVRMRIGRERHGVEGVAALIDSDDIFAPRATARV
jgi:hypothetical protein